MILKGGTPGCIAKPGPGIGHGITPAQVSSGGNADSPLLNDFDPGDTNTQLLWVLLNPLVATGTTTVSDDGDYQLVGAADGTWTQGYRILWAPFTGAPGVDESEIVTTVGEAAPEPEPEPEVPTEASGGGGYADPKRLVTRQKQRRARQEREAAEIAQVIAALIAAGVIH